MKHLDFILLDLVCLHLAYFLSFFIRNGRGNVYQVDIYQQMAYVITLISICVAFVSDNYKGILHRGYLKEVKYVFTQSVYVAVFEGMFLFMTKNADAFSRIALIVCMILYMFLMYIVRNIWKYVLKHWGSLIQTERAVLLVTTSELAEQIAVHVQSEMRGPLKFVGFGLLDAGTGNKEFHGIPIVASGEKNILEYIQNRWVEEVFIQVPNDKDYPGNLIKKCEIMGITVHRCFNFSESMHNMQIVEKFCDYTVLTSCIRTASMQEALYKRMLDIVGSIVGLIFTGLLILVIGPCIYIASPGSIFFSQERVGRGGRKFKIYKFRSMYLDAEKKKKDLLEENTMQGLMFKLEHDPRIIGSGPEGTRHGIGWFIRKYSIDEFPQFWNVLKGEMSLVGTRPPTVDEWNQYEFHHRSRLAIKPGITGLWQISGRSDITDFEEVVKMDMQYIRDWCLSEDIKILVKTIAVVIRGKGSK